MDEKNALRALIRKKAAALPPEYYRECGKSICERILSGAYWQQAESVMAFCPTDREPDLSLLLSRARAEGKPLLLPCCLQDGRMEARHVRSPSDLVPGAYGIPCPRVGCAVFEPARIGLVLVPCLSCTPEGVRLGHGGGWYDRFLADYRATSPQGSILCLCPERLLSAYLPRETHDILMPAVMTEKRLILP